VAITHPIDVGFSKTHNQTRAIICFWREWVVDFLIPSTELYRPAAPMVHGGSVNQPIKVIVSVYLRQAAESRM